MDENLADEIRKFNGYFRTLQEEVTKDLFSLIDGDECLEDINYSNLNLLEKRIDNAIALHHGQVRMLID